MVADRDAQVIGTVLEGRYRVLSLLGRGGMGDVYVGEDTRLRRRCALKILHAKLAEDRTSVERFLREAQMIASLDHPNIVDIYAFGEEPSGLVFFAMELLAGEDLDARLRARAERPFSAHEACNWALQIAQAVAFVHDAGLIHRDLKVSNVFLARRRDGEEACKLLDFGIARAETSSDLTETGVTLGTPSYMSPEQVRGNSLDRRSDIYSFGVVLFKLLTGRVPFTGEPIQVAMQHCECQPAAPSSVAPAAGVSPALDAIVLRAMAKRPEDRFQSMHEAAHALAELLRAEAPELAPVTRVGRPPTQPEPPPREPASEPVAAPGDAPTPDSLAAQTGQTAAMPAQPARGGRSPWLAVVGAVVLAGVVAVVLALDGGLEAPPPVAEAPKFASMSPPPPPPPRREAPPPPEPEPEPAPPEPDPEALPMADEDLPPLEPEVLPEPQPARRASKGAAAPADPLKQIERKAQKCRKTHGALDGPKIVVDYAIGLDGKVTRSIPSSQDALGKCLAAAVLSTRFEPKLVLGRKLSL